VAQKKSLRQTNYRSDSKFVLTSSDLANLGAEELSVALEAHLSAAKQISHGRDRLLGIAGAGTNGEDQIAE
jgi:hypothetical protein